MADDPPSFPSFQEGYEAGKMARGRRFGGPPRLPWVISAPVVSSTFEELTKRELHPLDAFSRLLEAAERNRPPDCADAFRFRWFGLHYLAPARDGFRLRVRVPGGRLFPSQLRGLAELAQELASGYVQVNEQAGIDLQTISIRDAPEAVRRVEALGLGTRGAGGDCLRAIVNDWHAWPETNALQDGIMQLELRATRDRALADLPRGCVIRFCALGTPPVPDGGNTLLLQVIVDEPAPFRVRWNGGKSDPGIVLSLEQVADFCVELLKQWARQADRTTRAAASLANFCAQQEPAALFAALERQLPFTLTRMASADTIPIRPTANLIPGTENTLPNPVSGRLLSAKMFTLADQATEAAGFVQLTNFPTCKETEPNF